MVLQTQLGVGKTHLDAVNSVIRVLSWTNKFISGQMLMIDPILRLAGPF